MKRILMLLTVVALMVVMLAMSVAPAFAGGWNPATGCRVNEKTGGDFVVPESFPGASGVDGKRTDDDVICMDRRLGKDGFFVFSFYDNRPPAV